MELTLEECKKYHKELWTWLSNNPEKGKNHWPKWKKNGGKITDVANYCFGCHISYQSRGGKGTCRDCPIVWPDQICNLFDEWLYCPSDEPDKKYKLAREIANLPWKGFPKKEKKVKKKVIGVSKSKEKDKKYLVIMGKNNEKTWGNSSTVTVLTSTIPEARKALLTKEAFDDYFYDYFYRFKWWEIRKLKNLDVVEMGIYKYGRNKIELIKEK